jgi:voltage-gated potassium channel
MSKRLVLSALAQFTAKTAGRNMTKAAYAAVAAGVAAMVVLTSASAYEAAHHWVDAVLWTCLVYFVFEWLVRLRHMAGQGRLSLYALSSSGVVDAIGALAVPVALLSGIEPRTAWLLSILWVLKVVPGIPGLRQLRRVLVLESGPLLSVLVIFLMVVFLASVAE